MTISKKKKKKIVIKVNDCGYPIPSSNTQMRAQKRPSIKEGDHFISPFSTRVYVREVPAHWTANLHPKTDPPK